MSSLACPHGVALGPLDKEMSSYCAECYREQGNRSYPPPERQWEFEWPNGKPEGYDG